MSANPIRAAETDDVALLARLTEARGALVAQVGRRIVGQREVLDGILTAILAGGHALLVGVPGLAKTLIVSTIAETLDLVFQRIQFTPDLMPSDITGTEILEEDQASGKRSFRFVRGPVFANVVLADEINRTPPKTQAALLQAMQEHAVTAAGVTYPLPEPFFVLATQNPIEQEGTYPLPEAQLDRFMFELTVSYPSRDEEERIAETTTGEVSEEIRPVLDADALRAMQRLVRRVPVAEPVVRAAVRLARMTRPSDADAPAAVRLARMTRPSDADAPAAVREFVSWGAGPRASQYLVLGAKARAALDGRPLADYDDVREIALSVLRHRVVLNFAAEAAGRTADDLCRELVDGKEWMR